jgi:uncharacterized repeat protein (TIGR03803 family)
VPSAVAVPVESVIAKFAVNKTGDSPAAPLLLGSNGVLYGATYLGPPTVFELTPAGGKTGWTTTVLHGFGGDYIPSGLTQAPDGTLYGTTLFGGTAGHGDVYALSPPPPGLKKWKFTELYSFTGGADGNEPVGAPILDGSGALYGATSGGDSEKGTVFKLTPPAPGGKRWALTVLSDFGEGGSNPQGRVVMDRNGVLYGTTLNGGDRNLGTVFAVSPPAAGQSQWTETVLHSFLDSAGDGCWPRAGVILDSAGALYGTTIGCGTHGLGSAGVVFRLSPPSGSESGWTETILHSFDTLRDGNDSESELLMDNADALFGVTRAGGRRGQGMAFRLDAPPPGQSSWTETVLYNFEGRGDGGDPDGALVADDQGNLFGTAATGGRVDEGVAFELGGTGFVP